jgi:hypothetical protein
MNLFSRRGVLTTAAAAGSLLATASDAVAQSADQVPQPGWGRFCQFSCPFAGHPENRLYGSRAF